MKKIFRFFATFVTVWAMIQVPLISAEEGMTQSRNVTLIYDDSGSMWKRIDPHTGKQGPSDNWKLANYALQSLIALLGERDKLHVVRMSDEENPVNINLPYHKRQKEIERISKWEGKGYTPFQTVRTSIETMLEQMEENPNEEYWFIIIMDGAFNELYWSEDRSEDEKENNALAFETLNSFHNEVIKKGIRFRSILVTTEAFLTKEEIYQIERFKEEVWDQSLGGLHLRAQSEEEIIDRINEVAAIMTNRDPKSHRSEVTLNPQLDGNQVTLVSPYPLKRITVLQQDSGNAVNHKIKSFKVFGNEDLFSISGPFQIETPYDPEELRDTIYGSISHISQSNLENVIPNGTYTLTFEEVINIYDFQFIVEPALDFNIDLYLLNDDGTLSSEKTTFFHGSNMKMAVRFTERGENSQSITFTSEEVVNNVQVTANIGEEVHDLHWDPHLGAFTTDFIMPDTPISSMVEGYIKGFYQEEKEYDIVGIPLRTWELIGEHDEWSYSINEISGSHPLLFTPYVNGVPITEEELAQIFDQIHVSVEGKSVDLKLVQDGSSIKVIIEAPKFPFLISAGEREITVTVQGPYMNEEATAVDQITLIDLPFLQKYGVYLLYLLIFLLIIIYIIGIIKKNRFDRRNVLKKSQYQIINGRETTPIESTIRFRTSFIKRWLWPYAPESITIDGLIFKAAPRKDHILLAKKSQKPELRIGRSQLREDAGRQDIPIFINDMVTRESNYMKETYTFFRNS